MGWRFVALSAFLLLSLKSFVFGSLSEISKIQFDENDSPLRKRRMINIIKTAMGESGIQDYAFPSELDIPLMFEDKIETYEKKLTRGQIAELSPQMFLDYLSSFDEELKKRRLHCSIAERNFVYLANELYLSALKTYNSQPRRVNELDHHLQKIRESLQQKDMSIERNEWITRIYFILAQSLHSSSTIYQRLPELCGTLSSYRELWYSTHKFAKENLSKGFTLLDKIQYTITSLSQSLKRPAARRFRAENSDPTTHFRFLNLISSSLSLS
ncbi:hypothetical protein DFH28DRAFT_1106629 [Melampsora americana]|nr:hypothetical protein DFH28DRAFT_1106629 [Melampsora americana]